MLGVKLHKCICTLASEESRMEKEAATSVAPLLELGYKWYIPTTSIIFLLEKVPERKE
jgi:hypothetical protein